MAVFKPTRKGETSKYYVCEFVYQGKRFQESTGTISKTVAKEYEKQRKKELERAAAGLPTEQKAARIRTVKDVVDPYLAGYKLSHRPKSILFANGRLAHVKKALGGVVLSDLTDERIKSYIRHHRRTIVDVNRHESRRGAFAHMGTSGPHGESPPGWPRQKFQRYGPHHPDQ